MNSVCLMGRLTKDPEIRTAPSGLMFANFNVAVDRRLSAEKRQEAQNNPNIQTADFPRVTAIGKTAEFIQKYFRKGDRIAVVGHIETGSYQDQSGKTVYTTDVLADNVEFCESKNNGGNQGGGYQPQQGYQPPQGYAPAPQGFTPQQQQYAPPPNTAYQTYGQAPAPAPAPAAQGFAAPAPLGFTPVETDDLPFN